EHENRVTMTQSKPQAPSQDHHFIPKFLLRAWAGDDRKVACCWPRDDGIVRPGRLSPKSFGYRTLLYTTQGLPPEHAQQMEDKFFKRLDDRAAKAHELLVAGRVGELTDATVLGWANFVISLWFRTPTDIDGLGEFVDAFKDPDFSESKLGMATPEALPDGAYSALQMEAVREAIYDPALNQALVDMNWYSLETETSRRFMISDWPTHTAQNLPFLGHPNSYIAMPISPKRIFIAAASDTFIHEVLHTPQAFLVDRVNEGIVAHARHFVGYADEGEVPFIKSHFASAPRPSVAGTIRN
ncbi:DUF4238 domain-containing protein, partial [Sphingomonas sp. TREG-RG-20F-R18-01]|uniref:DUF4238 domain-containing protein n=1 Tax=Sphingomonas sp. TREG-RG-20F-R18-01 TaxID=2914982 RepID=UPI001F585236